MSILCTKLSPLRVRLLLRTPLHRHQLRRPARVMLLADSFAYRVLLTIVFTFASRTATTACPTPLRTACI
eukprot:1346943-Heterocapsa_arctica.AAC.1